MMLKLNFVKSKINQYVYLFFQSALATHNLPSFITFRFVKIQSCLFFNPVFLILTNFILLLLLFYTVNLPLDLTTSILSLTHHFILNYKPVSWDHIPSS